MDYEEEENLTVYIEELKSDDPSLKVNAAQKITAIAGILGLNRTKVELIPFLIEILEECDNDEEFLMTMADQLRALEKYIEPSQVHILLAPLEIISSMEDIQVRNKAIDCIKDLVHEQDNDFFAKFFFPMIKQLAQWDHYNSRISATSLLATCYDRVSDLEKSDIIQMITDLSKDDTPMVRRGVAQNLSPVLQISNPSHSAALLEIWIKLIKDEFDSVRICAIEITMKILKHLQKSLMSDVLSSFEQLKQSSWRVKYSVVEILPTLIQNSNEKNQLLMVYKKLLQDQDLEVKSIAILKIPEIAGNISQTLFEQNVFCEIKTLIQDQQYHIRSSIASIMTKIYKYLSITIQSTEYFEIFEKLLKDEILDVKQSLLSQIPQFSEAFDKSIIEKKIIPMIINFQQEINWRARLLACQQIPALCKALSFEQYQTLAPLLVSFQNDHYFSIRIQFFQNYRSIVDTYGYQAIQPQLMDSLSACLKKDNYMYRITALQSINELKDVIKDKDLQEIWESDLIDLQNDKVANVKFNLLKTYIQIQKQLTQPQQNKMRFVSARLKTETDEDIAYYAKQIN